VYLVEAMFFGKASSQSPVSTGESKSRQSKNLSHAQPRSRSQAPPGNALPPGSAWRVLLRSLLRTRLEARFARAFDFGGQVTKGVWGMSWRQEALKGVEDCDKRGVAVKQAMIP
jgi:hypothetical protein